MTRPPDTATEADRDDRDLSRFGYPQRLRRTLGGFSSFAVAFSLISVLTGVSANFGHGLRQVGGAVVWSWLAVLCGQVLVAWVMCGLARRLPLSGYGYQWATRLLNPHVGYAVGWLLVLQLLTGFPGICATLARSLAGLIGDGRTPSAPLITGLTLAVIAAVALVQLWGLRLAARINDTGVWAELIGVAALVVVLGWMALRSGSLPGALFEARQAATGGIAGAGAWALSLLLGAWCLTGFEAAADLAEETLDPRRAVPRAMMTSLVGSGVAGFLLLAGAVGALGDLAAAQASGDPLLDVLRRATGSALPAVLGVLGVSIFACALACMAAASRLLFALGRDGMLPCGRWLAGVASGHGIPRNAILLVWAVSSLVVVALPSLDLVSQISAVAGYLGYAGTVCAALFGKGSAAGTDTGPTGTPRVVGALALCWTLGVVAALTLSPTPVDGFATRHLPAWSTGFGLAAGLAIYLGWIRGRLNRGEAGPPRIDPETPSLPPS